MHRRHIAKALVGTIAGATLFPRQGSAQACNVPCYPQTPQESNAGITPVNTRYKPGDVRRYGATGNDNTDDRAAIQNAFDSGANEVFFPSGTFRIGAPLYVKANGTQNLTLVGEGRTNTYLAPLATNISDGLGINAMIINQHNNGKFSIRNMRFWSDVGYTGIVLYAVESGSTAQAIFSGSIDNCWFSLPTTNSGMFRGALNNYRVSNCTFESCKGCFFLEGAGNADIYFENNVVYLCYDSFIDQTADAIGSNIISVKGLHAYSHYRGQLIKLRNSHHLNISDVILQAMDPPVAPVGLFGFHSCKSVIVDSFNASIATIFGGSGPIGEAITIEDSSVKLSNGLIDGADAGVHLSGNGAVDVSLDSVDIKNSTTAAFWVQYGALIGPTGSVRAANCNWSDSLGNIVLFSHMGAFDLTMSSCRILNAGLGGISSARNVSIATTGTVRLNNCEVGRKTSAAAASYYFYAGGSGEFVCSNLATTGTPPTAVKMGPQNVSRTVETFAAL